MCVGAMLWPMAQLRTGQIRIDLFIDLLFIREYINNMRPTGATRGRIKCGSTLLITIHKSTNTTNYKRMVVDVVGSY